MKLHFVTEDFKGQAFEVPQGKTTVGRSKENALVIDDASVSAIHCELLRHGNELIVREHGSANGTTVGGMPVQGQTPVRHGQTIQFGRVSAVVPFAEGQADVDNTAMTAIHLHASAVRREQAPPPDRPLQQVVRSQRPADTDHTLLMKAPSVSAPSALSPAATVKARPRSMNWTVALLVAAALGAIAFALLLVLAR